MLDSWLFDGCGGAIKLSFDEFTEHSPSNGEWLWAHLNFTDGEVQNWIKGSSGLSEVTASALLADETRPRCEPIDNGTMLFLRGVNLNKDASPEDMISIRMWFDSRRLISLRQRRLMSIDDIRSSFSKNCAPCTPGDFVVRLIEKLLDFATNVTETLYDQVDELEAGLDQPSMTLPREQLATVHRQAISLRRYLAPQRDAVVKLAALNSAMLSDENRTRLREDADRLTRIVEGLIAARERATVVQELIANRNAEQTNRRMYILSIISAVFLPLTFVTGLLGMNVGGIPGGASAWGFIAVSGLIIAIALVILALFRFSRWY